MFRAITAAIFLTLAALATPSHGQGLQARANEIRAAMDARDFARAESLARALAASDAAVFTANNYDYLLARLAERRGANAEAQSLYLALVERRSILTQYALWHLSQIARRSNDLALERQYITRLLTGFPSSTLTRSARERMIESLHESGDYRSSVSLLRPIASARGVLGRSAMARLGEAYSKIGDASAARSGFDQLLSGSRDDYALAAATGLDALDRAAAARPSEFEALRRARVYLHNRHWPEARTHLIDIVNRIPDSPNRAEALYQTGFTFYREDNYDEAIKWFERAHAEFPGKKEGEQGYYYVGTALQKARRYEEAARRYSDFITAYPESDLIEGAYRNVVDSLRYAEKYTEAIQWSRRIGEVFAGRPLAVVALYNEAKIELVRGRYNEAVELLIRLQAQPIYPRLVSAPIRGEAAFLRILALEKMGRLSEAAQLYMAIPDERENYFGHRATERLLAIGRTTQGRRITDSMARGLREQARAALQGGRYSEAKDAATRALRLSEDATAQRDLLAILRTSYSRLPAYSSVSRFRLTEAARPAVTARVTDSSRQALAAELIFLGLYDEGAPELRLGGFGGARSAMDSSDDAQPDDNSPRPVQVSAPSSGGDTAYSLAVYNNRGDHAQYAIAFAEPLFNSIPKDYRIDLMPRDLAELMYPAPYRDALNRYAPRAGVDPRLVLALARQESRFNPSVKSAAAARGLLQFISETATKTAAEEGIRDFELDDVYNPETAVRLAVRYTANLFKLFPNNPHAVAASYNTGEPNVERWIFRAKSDDVDLLLAEIAIPETKDYVAKVMNNYRAYRLLYTDNLAPRFP
ncbi:MAG TPA: transglycosylase SLT domain-containing protein [Blastocatellia bacterium]|nr:transglycosylase SLT domain-containing protein [Blastocatellia bacterium]